MHKSDKSQSHQGTQIMENKETKVLKMDEIDEAKEIKDDPEVRVVFNLNESYRWASHHAMEKQMEEMITLSNDIGELSIYAAGETIFKSHVYSGLGCALYEGKPLILWIDYPLEILKKYCQKKQTNRIYWNDGMKGRTYSCLTFDGHHFGLSPAVQELKFLKEDCMRDYGLRLKEGYFGFMENDWDAPIRYVELDIEEVNKEPTKTKLVKYLEMEEEEMKAEKSIQNLRKKKDEKLYVKCSSCNTEHPKPNHE